VARRGSELQWVLTLGGQVPRTVGAMVVAMVLTTALVGLVPEVALLLPLRVEPHEGVTNLVQVWRLVTWPFPQSIRDVLGLLNLVFAVIWLVWLARRLSYAWGERRFLARFFTLAVGAGLLTYLTFWLLGVGYGYAGAWPVLNALVITWGLIFPNERLSLYGTIQMTGQGVANLFTVGTPIYALVAGGSQFIPMRLLEFTPHLAGVALAWLLVAGGPRRGWYRLKDWWLRRKLERQRRKFKVISTDRPRPKPWMN
jgi:membrane associated rhomboid family serine protease